MGGLSSHGGHHVPPHSDSPGRLENPMGHLDGPGIRFSPSVSYTPGEGR